MALTCPTVSRRVLFALLPMVLGACTTVGGGVRPAAGPGAVEPREVNRPGTGSPSTPHEDAPEGRLGDPLGSRVVRIALESIGTPYRWGGTDANGFDCSGLIQFAYGRVGITIPRRSTAQIRAGSPVDPDAALLRPGDVLGFSGNVGGKTSHVGLYIGDDRFIHSSSRGVRISTLRDPYWQGRLVAARRIAE